MSLAISLAGALLVSCEREETPVVEEPGDLIRIEASGTDPQTRGLLNKADLKKAGTTVKVYDYLTGFTGKIDNQSYTNGSLMYINDSVTLGTEGGEDWGFSSGYLWRWTRTGTHNFYGYLDYDAVSGLRASSLGNITFANNVLSVPTIVMGRTTSQFDFSYSDKVSVNVENKGDGSVILPLNHLFSSLALTIENQGDDDVNIVGLTLQGVKNSKSATVNYTGATPIVDYSVENGSNSFIAPMAGKELDKGTKVDLFTGEAAGTASNYLLMWPQTASEVEEAKFVLSYTIDGFMDPENQNELQVFEKVLKFTDTGRFKDGGGNKLGLDAGKKYSINILFKGKTIDLTLRVMPWDYQTFDLDYSQNTITAKSGMANEGVMWLYYWGYDSEHDRMDYIAGDRDSRTVVMASGTEVHGRFYIESPHAGRWQLTMYPAEAASFFTVEPSSGAITDEVIKSPNNGLVEFSVKANGNVPSQQIVHFNLAFQFNGETQWRDGNSEFNRKDWKIVREP